MNRTNVLVLSIIILVMLLLACVEEGGSSGGGSCYQLWIDCEGVANDVMVSGAASDLEQYVEGPNRFFSYYSCEVGQRLQGSTSANCSVVFKY